LFATTSLSGIASPETQRLSIASFSVAARQCQADGLTNPFRAAHLDAMNRDAPVIDSRTSVEETILSLCRSEGTRTICPTDAAKAHAEARGEDELGWRSHLNEVRRAAVRLAEAGRLVIYRKGKPVDPHDFRGVYRLGLPRVD
jgi:hypothetical protein